MTIHLDFKGSDFEFGSRGTNLPANYSDWINAQDSPKVKVMRGDTVVPWDDIAKGAGACVRLEVHTADASSAMAYLTLIPLPYADLLKLVERWEVDITGTRVPVIALQVGDPSGKKRSLETELMIREDKNAGYGLGVLPLIQQVNNVA